MRETWQEVYETEFDSDAPGSCVNIRTLIPNFDFISKVEAGVSTNCSCAAMKPRMKYYVFKASDIEYVDPQNKLVWRPSIHMPREAARIFLRVTDVRVERLQKMRIADFKAEGIIRRRPKDLPGHGCDCAWKHDGCLENPCANRDAYEYMCWDDPFSEEWDSTIKPADRALYGWAANPWVWVIEFERISGEEAAP